MNVKVIEESGRLTEFNSPSVVDLDALGSLERILQTNLAPGQYVAFCGRLPDGVPSDWYAKAISAAKSSGVKTVLDASGVGLEQGILAAPNIVKPNQAELSRLFNQSISGTREVLRAAGQLLDQGIEMVVVSLGAGGLIGVRQFASNREAFSVEVPFVHSGSSVGAGDTLVAGLLYSIHHHYSFDQTLRFAAAAGTAAVRTPGTKPPTLCDVQNLFETVRVTPLAL